MVKFILFESEGTTIQIDEAELDKNGRHPFLHPDAKRLDETLEASTVPEPIAEAAQTEDAETVETPADADPAPVEESHKPKSRRKPANKADTPAEDK